MIDTHYILVLPYEANMHVILKNIDHTLNPIKTIHLENFQLQ
jgi:hypothetical protein